MGTVPTAAMERELRALYLRWVGGIGSADDLDDYMEEFRRKSLKIINKYGSTAARAGAAAGFPVPKELDLSPVVEGAFNEMKEVAMRAGIASGLNAREIAKAMFDAGMDQTYYKLERLARTEVVSAYWQNQWDSVDGLGLVMVWGSEESPRTCPWCLAKDGLVVTDRTIRDHPNGRCTLVPTLPEEVNLRRKSRNPNFTRGRSFDPEELPKSAKLSLAHGLDVALTQDLSSQQAVSLMVSQGWSTGEAYSYLVNQWSSKKVNVDYSRRERSAVFRALERYAQDLWDNLATGSEDMVVYRGGKLFNSKLVSWTTNQSTAEMYNIRNRGQVLKAVLPKNALRYDLSHTNQRQKEMLVMGDFRPVSPGIGMIEGRLDKPIEMFTYQDYMSGKSMFY